MKTAVLDGRPLNPGDLSWDWLGEIGEYKVFNNTSPDEMEEHIGDAEIIINNKVIFDKAALERFPQIKYMGITATGYNIIDLQESKKRGIVVTNAPAYSTMAVAQHTFALMLEIFSKTGAHIESVHSGDWAKSPDFCYTVDRVYEITGKTLGIIGCGSIGSNVAEIARAFGMNVLIYSRTKREGYVELDELLEKADVISLHCPQTDSTKGMINKNTISKMKNGVVIINTARGGLIEEKDLANALNNGKVKAFGADVLGKEPPEKTNPLVGAKNTYITPHIAWASYEARKRLMDITRDNLLSYLNGNPKNQVN